MGYKPLSAQRKHGTERKSSTLSSFSRAVDGSVCSPPQSPGQGPLGAVWHILARVTVTLGWRDAERPTRDWTLLALGPYPPLSGPAMDFHSDWLKTYPQRTIFLKQRLTFKIQRFRLFTLAFFLKENPWKLLVYLTFFLKENAWKVLVYLTSQFRKANQNSGKSQLKFSIC